MRRRRSLTTIFLTSFKTAKIFHFFGNFVPLSWVLFGNWRVIFSMFSRHLYITFTFHSHNNGIHVLNIVLQVLYFTSSSLSVHAIGTLRQRTSKHCVKFFAKLCYFPTHLVKAILPQVHQFVFQVCTQLNSKGREFDSKLKLRNSSHITENFLKLFVALCRK